MEHSKIEWLVGIFLVLGFLAFGWLGLRLGEAPLLSRNTTYALNAVFNNIAGLRAGANVQIAGVTVGQVRRLRLDAQHQALVTMQLDRDVTVPVDSIASVKSQGIIGDKYIQITLGGDEKVYNAGETLVDTESAVDIESLISKFAFGQIGPKKE